MLRIDTGTRSIYNCIFGSIGEYVNNEWIYGGKGGKFSQELLNEVIMYYDNVQGTGTDISMNTRKLDSVLNTTVRWDSV